ncbi:pericentriolar material 1 protein-like isoform X1 [Branchiostoma floridae]|uniref:Pericentriolar material 1 protein-like isoform X1 n=1 Tax=Branchiostoma floridae TaxID=7739 RepID=A0A9J7MWL9_BRAFL|nr:pericentriolar material 1 protein-like isoform X1 [Branchiostoma floridae]
MAGKSRQLISQSFTEGPSVPDRRPARHNLSDSDMLSLSAAMMDSRPNNLFSMGAIPRQSKSVNQPSMNNDRRMMGRYPGGPPLVDSLYRQAGLGPGVSPRSASAPLTMDNQLNVGARMTVGANNAVANNERSATTQVKPSHQGARVNQLSLPTRAPATATAAAVRREEASSVESLEPDTSHIIGRLMQIRDYLKQAKGMLSQIENSTGTSWNREQRDKLQELVGHLEEQEKGYLGLLQRILAGDREGEAAGQADDDTSVNGSVAYSMSLDLGDARSDISEVTSEATYTARNRPQIEDHLGFHSSSEMEQDSNGNFGSWDNDGRPVSPGPGARRDHAARLLAWGMPPEEPERAVSPEPGARRPPRLAWATPDPEELNNQQDAARAADTTEKASGPEEEDLEGLRQQKELLRKMLEQQEQLRQLQDRQRMLVQLQEEVQDTLQSSQAAQGEEGAQGGVIPEAVADRLKDKLQVLQGKQEHMADLMRQLHSLQHLRQMHELDPTSSSVTSNNRQNESIEEAMKRRESGQQEPAARAPAVSAPRQDTENKLRKLQDVRERLNQLRELVRSYQASGFDDETITISTTTSQQRDSDYLENGVEQDDDDDDDDDEEDDDDDDDEEDEDDDSDDEEDDKEEEEEEGDMGADGARGQEDNVSLSSSTLATMAEDPVIKEKVRKLQEAKEKLRRLQDLVSVMQTSSMPGITLPKELADLLGETEEEDAEEPPPHQARAPPSLPDSTASSQPGQSMDDQVRRMQEEELASLLQEKERLMAIQQELLRLQDAKLTMATAHQQEARTDSAPSSARAYRDRSTGEAPQPQPRVQYQGTSASQRQLPPRQRPTDRDTWEELRQQMMLREEIRRKRTELEDLVRTERQARLVRTSAAEKGDFSVISDTSGFPGYSVMSGGDVTMATWGGSTQRSSDSVQDQGMDFNSMDEGYPSDGIVQAEEEEEEDGSHATYTIERGPGGNYLRLSPRADQDLGRIYDAPSGSRGYSSSRDSWRNRQENYRSAEELMQEDVSGWVVKECRRLQDLCGHLQQQMGSTTNLCQALLADQQLLNRLVSTSLNGSSGYGSGSASPQTPRTDLLAYFSGQLQQKQQLLAQLLQCYNQLSQQQHDLVVMQQTWEGAHSLQDPNHPAVTSPTPTSAPFRPDSNPFSHPQLSPFASYPSQPRGSFAFSPSFPANFPNPDTTQSYRLPMPGSGYRGLHPTSEGMQQTDITIPPEKLRRQSDVPARPPAAAPVSSGKGRTAQAAAPTSVPKLDFTQLKKARESSRMQGTPDSKTKKSKKRGHRGTMYEAEGDQLYQSFPHVTAGISGTAFQDTTSISSKMSSVTGSERPDADVLSSHAASEVSLFEALRDTIYSEVATLISQNESRPHFLIELFRELQMLTSDYLRRRALYALQDLVTRYLTEDSIKQHRPPISMPVNLRAWLGGNSEQTPSDSMVTSDNEGGEEGRTMPGQYDYMEDAGSASSMSTPQSEGGFDPFANDDLGNTVIHLDRAMHRMREYERLKAEAEGGDDASPHSSEPGQANTTSAATSTNSATSNSSAQDVGSESSISDGPYPRVDTQQLDQEIKAIMTEVIPHLKEHMEEVCSPQLLAYIRRLVMSLTRHRDDSKEFSRFFHKQLGTILQDSLQKFVGRKMRDCGEDLLVDISEILFNELAFFRLMQDLDSSPSKNWLQPTQSGEEDQTTGSEAAAGGEGEAKSDSSSSTETGDEDGDTTPKGTASHTTGTQAGWHRDKASSGVSTQGTGQGSRMYPEVPPVKFDLSVSELQPLTSYGSGEEDEEQETEQFEQVTDIPTGVQAERDVSDANTAPSANQPEQTASPQKAGSPAKPDQPGSPVRPAQGEESVVTGAEPDQEVSFKPKSADVNEDGTAEAAGEGQNGEVAVPEQGEDKSEDKEEPIAENGVPDGSEEAPAQVGQGDQVGEVSPRSLTALSKEVLEQQQAEEDKENVLVVEMIADGTMNPQLAGDPNKLPEVESSA